jgi:DNA (cytosine-5)-methyltransferase 1
MKHLDLFSGIGGFSVAADRLGIKTVQFVEIDPFCQATLRKNFPTIPIHSDVRTFTTTPNQFELVTAGFPCQDLSLANPHGRGLEGERSGLIYEALRIIREAHPRFVILENVPGLANRGLAEILRQLAILGFDAEWQTVSASSVGAPHQRKRLFVIAYPQGQRSPGNHSDQAGANITPISQCSWWRRHEAPEPAICRVDARLPRGMATSICKALGNTVVPETALVALKRVVELNQQFYND